MANMTVGYLAVGELLEMIRVGSPVGFFTVEGVDPKPRSEGKVFALVPVPRDPGEHAGAVDNVVAARTLAEVIARHLSPVTEVV